MGLQISKGIIPQIHILRDATKVGLATKSNVSSVQFYDNGAAIIKGNTFLDP